MRKILILNAAPLSSTYVNFAMHVGLVPPDIGYQQYKRKYTPPACYYKKHALQDKDWIFSGKGRYY